MKFTKKKLITFLICFAFVVVLIGIDQLTKQIAMHNLEGRQYVKIINKVVSFTLVQNKGAAWGMLSGAKWLLVTVSTVASLAFLVILYWFADFEKQNKKMLFNISLILICAGTIGNLIDRAFYQGGVIDFIYLDLIETLINYTFPVFNFADMCLTIGAVILFVYVMFFSDKADKHAKKLADDKEEDENELLEGEVEAPQEALDENQEEAVKEESDEESNS